MKFLIASDIHGSAFYCKKLLDRFASERADKLLILGDVLYHGPRNSLPKNYSPADVAAMLNPLRDKILCVRGNCDSEVDQMVLDFPIMAQYAILSLGNRTVFVTHGHEFNLSSPPPYSQGDILLHGHTHIPALTEQNGLLYINPGSVSIPKQNSPHSYIILENNTFTWKNTDGEIYMTHELGGTAR